MICRRGNPKITCHSSINSRVRCLNNRDYFHGHKSVQRTLVSTINLSKTCKRITFSSFNFISLQYFIAWGSKDGAMLIALPFHQCGLSLLLVLSFAPGGYSPGTPLLKSQHLQIPIPPGMVKKEPLCGCVTLKSLFIHLFIYVCSIYISVRNVFFFRKEGYTSTS